MTLTLPSLNSDLVFGLDRVADGFVALDQHWRITCINRGGAHIIGSEDFDSGHRPFLDAIHPEDRPRVKNIIQQLFTGRMHQAETRMCVEYRIIRPEGQIRWIKLHAFPISDAQGGISSICGVLWDITDSKTNEAQQHLLVEAGRILPSSLDYKTTLRNVADLVIPRFAI